MMRYITFILFFNLPLIIQAQCIADAGPDQHACGAYLNLQGDTIILGGQPTASAGTAPYTYSWFLLNLGSANVYTSDFLSDTSAANPKLYRNMVMGDKMTYVLKVTDDNNVSCFDTVTVTFSLFTYHLAQFQLVINAGDTVKDPFGPNGGSGRPPYKYLWRPNYGMIDSTSSHPTLAPNRTTSYRVIITDSAGCVDNGGDCLLVIVNHIDLEEAEAIQKIEVYPNPINKLLKISLPAQFTQQPLSFELTDATGKIVESFNSYSNEEVEREISLPDGVFLLKIFKDGQLLATRKMVVRN